MSAFAFLQTCKGAFNPNTKVSQLNKLVTGYWKYTLFLLMQMKMSRDDDDEKRRKEKKKKKSE